jgi:hypothetical protein
LNNVRGIAYRFRQAEFCGQFCDILVDIADGSGFAIEVKSISMKKNKVPVSWYGYYGDYEQYKKLIDFLFKSGKRGLYVFVLRYGSGIKSDVIPVDFNILEDDGKSVRIKIEDMKKRKNVMCYNLLFRSLDR